MRAMPSFTSSTVPTSRTSMSARSAAWISLRRISLSSPGLRMESVAMGSGVGVCETYHKKWEVGSDSHTGSRSSAQEPDQHPPRSQRAELLGSRARHASGRAGQVARRGVTKNAYDGAYRIAGVAQQIGGTRGAGQVDHPFQVRRAPGRELAREMLPRDSQRRRDV